MKKYFRCLVKDDKGKDCEHLLMLSQGHLISLLVQDHKRALVQLKKCTNNEYKKIFGEI